MLSHLVIDSSVWVSSLNPADPFHKESCTYLETVFSSKHDVVIPVLVLLETCHVLERHAGFGPAQLKDFCEHLYQSPHVSVVDMDGQFMGQCLTNPFKQRAIKTSDWIVAMTAFLYKCALVTWDKSLSKQAQKIIRVQQPSH